jgi:hypothetical protein
MHASDCLKSFTGALPVLIEADDVVRGFGPAGPLYNRLTGISPPFPPVSRLDPDGPSVDYLLVSSALY